MIRLELGEPAAIPDWAIRQRTLLQELEDAAIDFVTRYTRPDGTLVWREHWPGMDGSDDPYEAFQGLPMLYLLGGGERLLRLAHRQWNAVTAQWTAYGQIDREYDAGYDWMHHGEADNLFRLLGMADPDNPNLRGRAVRFAAMYAGTDPYATNYDPARKLIRSPLTGSRGPKFTVTAEDWSTHREVLDGYPPPFEDLPGIDGSTSVWSDDASFAEILDRMNVRMTRGDVPLNLTATSLLTHAYLVTGDQAYRQWVLDYHDAWRERTARNGGIVPDNVGLDDRIGQYVDGDWWGGYYGWRWPHGAPHILEAVAIADSNALLLTGDTGQLDLVRSQLDALWALGKPGPNGWLVPHRHVDSGWTDYRPVNPKLAVAGWSLSYDDTDADRVRRHTGSEAWGTPNPNIVKGNGAANNEHWFAYVEGRNPDYPVQILRTNQTQLRARLDEIEHDNGDPADWDIHHWQDKSPIVTEGLVQSMLGAPLHVYHGGLQHATVRYYDGDARRPGLPPDTAALVERVDADSATVRLVNCSDTRTRRPIVQGGAFGEHRIDTVAEVAGGFADGRRTEHQIAGRWFEVELKPRTRTRIRLTLRRHTNDPSYRTPWSNLGQG